VKLADKWGRNENGGLGFERACHRAAAQVSARKVAGAIDGDTRAQKESICSSLKDR